MKKPLTPHGPGFSFIDDVEILEKGRSLRAVKWLDPAAPFFCDHFPEMPLMPAVLLAEAAAQAAGKLWASVHGQEKPQPYVLAQIERFRVKRNALPGQTLEIRVVLEKDFGALARFQAGVKVKDIDIAEGVIILGTLQEVVDES
ncbi:MAG: hypothetical protein V1746_00030 [bacterium]